MGPAGPLYRPRPPPPPNASLPQHRRTASPCGGSRRRRASNRDALEGNAPQRRPQKRLDRRLEEVAKAVGGGYCRLNMPFKLVLAVMGAPHRRAALTRCSTILTAPPHQATCGRRCTTCSTRCTPQWPSACCRLPLHWRPLCSASPSRPTFP